MISVVLEPTEILPLDLGHFSRQVQARHLSVHGAL